MSNTYHVNYWVSIPSLAASILVTTYGHDRAYDKPPISLAHIDRLDPGDVLGLDRVSLRQDVSRYKRAQRISDFGIQYLPLLPAALFIDKRMRRDWLDIATVYIETQVVVLNFYNYSFLGPTIIERIRPIVYYEAVDLEERVWKGNRNSFFSGHTSTVSAVTYFMAQTYLNYHPEMRSKRWLLYGLAAIPPAYFGVKRIQGLKHFPTDVIAGYLIGAAGGIFWPKLHQKGRKRGKQVSMAMTYGPEVKAMLLRYRF